MQIMLPSFTGFKISVPIVFIVESRFSFGKTKEIKKNSLKITKKIFFE